MNNTKNTYHPIRVILHIIAFLALFLMEQLPLSVLTLTKKELGTKYSSYIKMAPLVTLILLIIAATVIIWTFKKAQLQALLRVLGLS
ncbi:hypothetical protein NBRC111452_1530 [Companilactobacillus farciminis]|nr:hypothetical protein NBRC111452_1530 [Companilactobacillus farciminis]